MRAMLTFAFVLCTAVPAAAQTLADYDYENLSFRGVGFDYGYIWPTKVASTPAYSVRLDLGFLGPGVRIAPTISYWHSEFRTSEIDRLAAQINRLPSLRDQNVTIEAADLGEIKWSDLSLGVDAHVVWTTPMGLLTYVGAGAAAHLLNGQGEFIDDTFVEDLLDSTTAGLAFMGGAELQATPRLRWYGEVRYTIASDVRYPGLRIGASLMLPPREAAQSIERTHARER